MADVLTREQRRLNMSRIRGSNTKPEMRLRSALHVAGLRFRIHRRDLPGVPDIVFPSKRVVVFVDGCFWHGCPTHAIAPKANASFWREKLSKNRTRDLEVNHRLAEAGWSVIRIWEHEVHEDVTLVVRRVATALRRASEK